LKVTFLGTGTSQGVPIIGCDCEVCTSTDVKDNRLRPAILLSHQNINLAVDIGPDFRQQMLRVGITELEAVLITHEHNDHVIGLDDVRPFNFRSKKDMPIYATVPVQNQLRERFDYIFSSNYPGIPRLQLHTIEHAKPFEVGGISILPIEVIHGRLPVLGFRFGEFTYITDAKTISEESLAMIAGTKYLVLNALHHNSHYAHLNLEEALALAKQLDAEHTYFTHISHHMGLNAKINKQLPANVSLAYDGLEIEFNL